MSDSHDLLPLYEPSRGFATAMRGYDRAQVDREISRLDDDVRIAASERDAAAARSADLAAQLASAQAQIESLRRQLRSASEGVTADNVDGHVKQILQAAMAEAERVKAEATDQATRTTMGAQTEGARIVGAANARMAEAEETYKQRMTDVDQHRSDVEAALATSEQRTRETEIRLSAEAAAERSRLDAEAQAERARLATESHDRCVLAEEDFDIAMRARRSKAQIEESEQKRAADAHATKTVADARSSADQLVADAVHEVRRLHELRNGVHADLTQLTGRLTAAVAESLAATPAEPELQKSHPMPGAGEPDDTQSSS